MANASSWQLIYGQTWTEHHELITTWFTDFASIIQHDYYYYYPWNYVVLLQNFSARQKINFVSSFYVSLWCKLFSDTWAQYCWPSKMIKTKIQVFIEELSPKRIRKRLMNHSVKSLRKNYVPNRSMHRHTRVGILSPSFFLSLTESQSCLNVSLFHIYLKVRSIM
jgi:hypothetical protein